MLLRRRTPSISSHPGEPGKGFEHLDQSAVALLRWLSENQVEHVLVGGVAEALRGRRDATGPVAIVPAPYRRNLARLSRALEDAGAGVRLDGLGRGGSSEQSEARPTADTLSRGRRWTLRCGSHDLDIEPVAGQQAGGVPSYQELLYEATRIVPADGLAVEVASPEDIEHYAHLRRTGRAPEMRISRQAAATGSGPAPTAVPRHDSPRGPE